MSERQIVAIVCDHRSHDDKVKLATHAGITVDLCNVHYAVFADAVAERSFTCPDCGKSFKSKGGLRMHETITHGREPARKPKAAKRTKTTRRKRRR